MLDLICVSSVLIVCSSLLFTWGQEGRKGMHSVPCRAAPPLAQGTSLSRQENQRGISGWKLAGKLPGKLGGCSQKSLWVLCPGRLWRLTPGFGTLRSYLHLPQVEPHSWAAVPRCLRHSEVFREVSVLPHTCPQPWHVAVCFLDAGAATYTPISISC